VSDDIIEGSMNNHTVRSPYPLAVSVSAQGTRLNWRGLETRRTILTTAVQCLADGGPEAVSANFIAKQAGVTWGTIQHQFGDADGLWAAVLDHVTNQVSTPLSRPTRPRTPAHQVSAIVEWMWKTLDTPGARAIQNLRLAFPRDVETMTREFPNSAAAMRRIEEGWSVVIARSFDGLVSSKTKLRRVRQMLPGAMRGIHAQSQLSTLTDPREARRGLAEAIAAYLND
jgi:AcrR family transcriptional regulator